MLADRRVTVNAFFALAVEAPGRSNGRGRDRGFPRPPAQIRAGRITALGSYLEYERRTGPKAKDDRFVRLAAIVRHVVSSDPTSSASSGSVAGAIGTISESLPCGTG